MNILLIDDDPECLKSLAAVLETAGYNCRSFTVPGEALNAFRQEAFDVVITDLRMPVINGIQVLQQIRSLDPDARVIILSGFWDEAAAAAAVNGYAYSVLGKPLKLKEVLASLEEIEQENRLRDRFGDKLVRLLLERIRHQRLYDNLQVLLKEGDSKQE